MSEVRCELGSCKATTCHGTTADCSGHAAVPAGFPTQELRHPWGEEVLKVAIISVRFSSFGMSGP